MHTFSNCLLLPSVLLPIVGFGCAVLLLLVPVWPVIGQYYVDVVFWLDAAHRIDHGQIPHLDYFAAFGPLPQYGMWLMQKIFPSAHPILAAQFFYVFLGLPLLALILADIRSRLESTVLAGGFIALGLLPANLVMGVFNFGFDIGVYNRQAGLLLYVLIAGLWWCRSPTRLITVVSCTLIGLLFTKITAFGAASALVFYAVLMGRISARGLIAIIIAIIVAASVLEIATGMVSAYMRDIGTMIGMATSSVSSEKEQDPLHRLAFTIYYSFELWVPVGLMIIAAIVRDRRVLAEALSRARNNRLEALSTFLQADGIAMSALLAAAMLIESQNAGSQEFAFLIPAVWYVMLRPASRDFAARAVTFLAAAFLLIVAVKVSHRTLLIASHVNRFPHLEASVLEPFHLSAKLGDVAYATAKLEFFSAQQTAYTEFASRGQNLDTANDVDFQLSYFLSIDDAVRALRRWQAEHNVQLNSVTALDFVDPFPTLLNLKPVLGLGIVMDPYRAAGQWTTVLRSLSTTDGILVPLCPVTNYRYEYAKRAKLEIKSRHAISIDPCWTLYVK
jgi:hypothetical protein